MQFFGRWMTAHTANMCFSPPNDRPFVRPSMSLAFRSMYNDWMCCNMITREAECARRCNGRNFSGRMFYDRLLRRGNKEGDGVVREPENWHWKLHIFLKAKLVLDSVRLKRKIDWVYAWMVNAIFVCDCTFDGWCIQLWCSSYFTRHLPCKQWLGLGSRGMVQDLWTSPSLDVHSDCAYSMDEQKHTSFRSLGEQ